MIRQGIAFRMRMLGKRAEVVCQIHEAVDRSEPQNWIRPPTNEPGKAADADHKPARQQKQIAQGVTALCSLSFFSSRYKNGLKGPSDTAQSKEKSDQASGRGLVEACVFESVG